MDVKILTGDNEIITAYICKQVGMPVENLLLGSQIEKMNEEQLSKLSALQASLRGWYLPIKSELSMLCRKTVMLLALWETASTMPRL